MRTGKRNFQASSLLMLAAPTSRTSTGTKRLCLTGGVRMDISSLDTRAREWDARRSSRRVAHGFRCAAVGVTALAAAIGATTSFAQIKSCDSTPKPPFCSAPMGDRAEGYLRQTRSEVVARNGMVTTSQALAAQAGLQILQEGGNAIDAAVAAAAVITLVEPTSTSVGSDVFAVIYIASENQQHFLNASGTAPTGATLAHYNSLGYF